eukprot:c18290_g1_i1 orf=463-663(-)
MGSKNVALVASLLLVVLLMGVSSNVVEACPCGSPPITSPYDTTKYECCVYGFNEACTLLCNKGCCP